MWLGNHYWAVAAQAARAAGDGCAIGSCEGRPTEVHHVTPIPVGSYGVADCRHHQDGLQLLCRRHHADVHQLLRARASRLASDQLELVT